MPRILRALLLLLTCAGLPACKSTTDLQKRREALKAMRPPAPVLYQWEGDHLTGPVSITIDLSEQKATIRRGGEYAGWTYVATGKSGYGTPTGSFRISEKVVDKHSGTWGMIEDADGNVVDEDARAGRERVPRGGRWVGASMPYWMRIHGPIGMHAGYIPDPGNPASHGCIRLPREMAERIYDMVKLGTPVRVTY